MINIYQKLTYYFPLLATNCCNKKFFTTQVNRHLASQSYYFTGSASFNVQISISEIAINGSNNCTIYAHNL